MTGEQKVEWKSTIMSFFKGQPATGQATAQAKRAATPRLQSLDFIRLVHEMLVASTQQGMQHFSKDEMLRALAKDEVPKVLVVCCDQVQYQWCGLYELELGPPSITIAAFRDPCHRAANDSWLALEKANLSKTIVVSILHLNIAYGPFQGAGCMRIIEDAAMEISVAEHADSPLLLRLWRQICLDRGWRAPHEVGPDARSKFLATLPAELCCAKKFDKAAASRWFSWKRLTTRRTCITTRCCTS